MVGMLRHVEQGSISYLLPRASYILPPTSHLPPPTSHLLHSSSGHTPPQVGFEAEVKEGIRPEEGEEAYGCMRARVRVKCESEGEGEV